MPRSWLETTVAEVKRTVSSHLLDIVMQRHGLLHHLSAIKRFLLLGQGDFVRVLLDSAQLELDKGAKDVSQYTLQVGGSGSAPGPA
jgi:gamma-tubulin complex component 3